jgi:endoglucanase
MTAITQTVLPRWRGFNLLDLFTIHSDGDFKEDDFRWIADWGFNFVRIPACYTLWIEADNVYRIYEPMLEKVDRLLRLGQQYGIHVCLNFHRGPGYSVNPERREPFDLWKDREALTAFCFHWELFTKRYQGIPSSQLSFNLINEPAHPESETMTRSDYENVVRTTVQAIRAIDPERLIIVDGVDWASTPLPEIADLAVAESCRAYAPMGISHYKASWVGGDRWPVPDWPGNMPDGEYWDRSRLERHYQPWIELAQEGVGVHCGEGGAFSYTPHCVFLGWFRDVLEILTQVNIGYALWNFRGGFGLLDSDRQDVVYEDWHGHKLDKQLLDLLLAC